MLADGTLLLLSTKNQRQKTRDVGTKLRSRLGGSECLVHAQLGVSIFFLVAIMALLICSNDTNITTFHDPSRRNEGTNLQERMNTILNFRRFFALKGTFIKHELSIRPILRH